MFRFFDRKRSKEQAAFAQFARKMKKVPGGEHLMRMQEQGQIMKRVQVLRGSGQADKARSEALDYLSPIHKRWQKTHDPLELHYIAETLRLCELTEECSNLLVNVIADWPQNYCIDVTWVCIDLGLVAHQQGQPPEKSLEWFNLALSTSPPNKARVVADKTIKARAAFCGFVVAASRGKEDLASGYLSKLRVLEPNRRWETQEDIESYGKSFIGFISPKKVVA